MKPTVLTTARSLLDRVVARLNPLANVRANVLEVRDLACLKKAFGWTRDPLLDAAHLQEFNYLADLNERRMRDAESIMSVCRNADPRTIVEIGTATGQTTALIAKNAPAATIHTVNIPPEEIAEGGTLVTREFSREAIGSAYREAGCTNVRQIFANTARWEPDLGDIDVAFVDGCHDTEFVFNDSRKLLAHMKPGSFLLWHDFHPGLVDQYDWIRCVCLGVEMLYQRGLITGRILHLQDSWVGIYQLPK